jgi:hypothetical protein
MMTLHSDNHTDGMSFCFEKCNRSFTLLAVADCHNFVVLWRMLVQM